MRSPARGIAEPTWSSPGVLDRGPSLDEAHDGGAPVNTLPPASHAPKPRPTTLGADHLGTDQFDRDTHRAPVGVDLNGDQVVGVTPETDPSPESEGNGQSASGPRTASADPSDALLLILADILNDIEGQREATANQLSALTRASDVPGGKGLSEFSRAAVEAADWLAVLKQREHKAVLSLQRAMRQHPLGPWVKATVGIGEKQGARLIAAIGDPAWNHAADRPRRGPAELWAYCGYAPGQKRRKGVQGNWNAEAKMRAYLCAESCMKKRTSPFRAVYDQARANWADRDTSDGHKHAHALRCVAKAILKDLWLAARATEHPTPKPASPVSANGATEREAA